MLNNKTPFPAQNTFLYNEQGIETSCTIVKASFNIDKQWTLSNEQSLPQAEDEYWGDETSSSLKYATDFHTGKATTDIVVLGNACAIDFKPVDELDVSVTMEEKQKILLVFGNRYWRNGSITSPESFTTLPLVYENAFGGQHHVEGELKSLEKRNPVGKGYQGEKLDSEMEGEVLPNIEDPQCLIHSMSDTPEPAAFGFKAPHWQPRADFGGTYDEQWQQSRAPYLPNDYDKRFQNAAHADLMSSNFLRGGEAFEITNMHPNGTLRFKLPVVKIMGKIRLHEQRKQPLHFDLETVIIKPGNMQLHMVWKASHVCYNDALNIKTIDLNLSR